MDFLIPNLFSHSILSISSIQVLFRGSMVPPYSSNQCWLQNSIKFHGDQAYPYEMAAIGMESNIFH